MGLLLLNVTSTDACSKDTKFLRLASLGGGPQAHVHMKGMKCRVL